ncbi:Uncharacterised protein [Yersinia pseudotuberculosis]|nr:Uncharacterised protein [Yersinia pseudotuberculosis]
MLHKAIGLVFRASSIFLLRLKNRSSSQLSKNLLASIILSSSVRKIDAMFLETEFKIPPVIYNSIFIQDTTSKESVL